MARESRSSRAAPTRTRLRLTTGARDKPVVTDDDEPPLKRRRYIPGGPGGGGRWQEADGREELVGGTGPGGYAYIGPRGRVGQANAAAFEANGTSPPVRPSRATAVQSVEKPPRPRREYSRRDRTSTRPRYSSAAAAAAAVVQGDGFKPREERGWEEFHQDLDVDADIQFFTADDIDGVVRTPVAEGTPDGFDQIHADNDLGGGAPVTTPQNRKRGRPPRKGDPLLKGIGSPTTPKAVPPPGPNPRERLTLPKPSCREADPFAHYENTASITDYVDRSMSSVGYQESDEFIRPEKKYLRLEEGTIEEELDLGPLPNTDGQANAAIGSSGVGRVEYDMDEQDQQWLEACNAMRKADGFEPIKPAIFEITMSKVEKEWHALEKRIPKPNPKAPQTHRPRSSSAAAVNGEQQGEEQDIKCAVCDDGDCENTNAIVFCDGCNLAVHQECYGVPYIPEGQWHCRRCGLIGRGIPTCIFCPNTDGAFKQATSGIWAHLLCAIWIPEVTIGNPSFMEPVMDVETVPRPRWRLTCYICKQKMGACIQCGNKNCFEAFHVTCARRAKLFLQMKSTHGGVSQLLDASVLKAFCHRHVPSDWRKEQNSDRAVQEAIQYYRIAMRDRKWADSQQAALNGVSHQNRDAVVQSVEMPTPKLTLTIGGKRTKKPEPKKNVWRLPSGAPVIPAVLFDTVDNSLQRFNVRKRKEFAGEMCRYWTLKREAKRGAALIKRLQLQMESFSSMEVTRRDFAAMGAIGRPRLRCRLTFADDRLDEVGNLADLAGQIKDREKLKLNDNGYLANLVTTVYFPIPALLQPIINKVAQLDIKNSFYDGLVKIAARNEEFFYTSVKQFSSDLSNVFSSSIGITTASNTAEVHAQLDKDRGRKDLSLEQKEKRKLAKRIIKAVQPALEQALKNESELEGLEYQDLLKELDSILEPSISSHRDSVSTQGDDEQATANGTPATTNDLDAIETVEAGQKKPKDRDRQDVPMADDLSNPPKDQTVVHAPTPDELAGDVADSYLASTVAISNGDPLTAAQGLKAPPTPPPSAVAELQTPLAHGGVPWHATSFDPDGTTVYEERWVGRRAMSEELSEVSASEFPFELDHDMNDTATPTATRQGGGLGSAASNTRRKVAAALAEAEAANAAAAAAAEAATTAAELARKKSVKASRRRRR